MKALIVSLESFQKGEIPEEVKKYVMSTHGNLFTILDESSKIKTNNPCTETKKSKRTQAIKRLGAIGDRCILTGTFMSKSPCNAYDQMNFLCPDFFPESMFAFAEHYEIRRSLPGRMRARILVTKKDWDAIRNRMLRNKDNIHALEGAIEGIRSFYGISRDDCMYIMEHKEYSPFKNISELWSRIGDVCLKVDKKDIFDMPPKTYKTFNVPLTKEQKRIYLELQNQHCTDKITVDEGLQLYLRFQDVCNGYEPVETDVTIDENGNEKHNVSLVPLKENPKLDMLEEIVDEIGNEQIVIWCSRTKLLYDAVERMQDLGYSCGIYDGKVGKDKREVDYNKFKNKEIQLIFINQASGAFGLDGLKEADYAIYLCNSYSVEQRQQSEERIYRGKVDHNKYIIDTINNSTSKIS